MSRKKSKVGKVRVDLETIGVEAVLHSYTKKAGQRVAQ